MKEFKIKFEHTLKETYTAVIEAESEEEALEIFEEYPFDYLKDDEPEDVNGLNIDIISVLEE